MVTRLKIIMTAPETPVSLLISLSLFTDSHPSGPAGPPPAPTTSTLPLRDGPGIGRSPIAGMTGVPRSVDSPLRRSDQLSGRYLVSAAAMRSWRCRRHRADTEPLEICEQAMSTMINERHQGSDDDPRTLITNTPGPRTDGTSDARTSTAPVLDHVRFWVGAGLPPRSRPWPHWSASC